MVYCGKPSKGCGACRARKVKCDQGTPSCQRCIKAHRECPGYRDQLSLLFRDQSSSVARKAKSNTTSVPSPSAVTTVTATTSPTPGSWRNHANTPTDYELTQTSVRSSPSAKSFRSGNYGSYDQHIDSDDFSLVPVLIDRRQQAICYCLKSFVWLNGSLIKGLDYNADISPTAPMAQKAMMKGILAVGMANLSRTGARSQSMKIEAQQEYYKALKFTNAAISHPTQATDDATLTAILCMSLFEILTSRRPERLDSFIQHTNGAVALLELRGRLRVIEPQSLHLFEFMRSEILVSCIMRWHPVPPMLLTVSEKAAMLPSTAFSFKASHKMCVLISRLIDLRVEIKGEKRAWISIPSSYLVRLL
uniref:Transcriptional regulatory protein moc3 n=1 Tax=Talaromyces marneffei PM1 TaxID=1077442 RepID=A0A093XAK9_TALMA